MPKCSAYLEHNFTVLTIHSAHCWFGVSQEVYYIAWVSRCRLLLHVRVIYCRHSMTTISEYNKTKSSAFYESRCTLLFMSSAKITLPSCFVSPKLSCKFLYEASLITSETQSIGMHANQQSRFIRTGTTQFARTSKPQCPKLAASWEPVRLCGLSCSAESHSNTSMTRICRLKIIRKSKFCASTEWQSWSLESESLRPNLTI